jgi:hypothetical protein
MPNASFSMDTDIDLDPSRFPTPDTQASEVALLDDVRRLAGEREVAPVEVWLTGDQDGSTPADLRSPAR